MAVVVGDFVRITAKMKLFGTEDVMNVFTYRTDVNATADDLAFMTDVALRIDAAYFLLLGDLQTSLTFVTIDGQNISKSELMPEVPWPVITSGSNAATILPTQVAAEVFWPTITPKVRTSTFFGGYAVSANDPGGVVAAGAIARLVSCAAILIRLTTANIDLVKGSWNPTKLLFTESGAAVVPSRWRTQRRRRVGVGS